MMFPFTCLAGKRVVPRSYGTVSGRGLMMKSLKSPLRCPADGFVDPLQREDVVVQRA
jgi:hypothetical protein